MFTAAHINFINNNDNTINLSLHHLLRPVKELFLVENITGDIFIVSKQIDDMLYCVVSKHAHSRRETSLLRTQQI